jgi:membrane protease YdiL (CAAX protease family)
MTEPLPDRVNRLPVVLRAIVTRILVGLIAANVWRLLLTRLGAPLGAALEIVLLAAYVWWASGGGAPRSVGPRGRSRFARAHSPPLAGSGAAAGLCFARVSTPRSFCCSVSSVSARRVPAGHDISFVPTPLRWLTVVISATSAGICEETGFRGYTQRPIEQRHGHRSRFSCPRSSSGGAPQQGLVGSGQVPIVFGAGVLLGVLAWPRLAGSRHDRPRRHGCRLFAYWWTGIAGDFTARPIAETEWIAASCSRASCWSWR